MFKKKKNKATPTKILLPVARPTHFLEKIETFFLPNIPPLFQLVALFLAVAILGMWSQTTDSYMYGQESLADYRQHLNMTKV